MSQLDMFAMLEEPAPPAPEVPRGPDLQSEVLQLLQHGPVSIFAVQPLHYDLTGRCHHFCDLYDTLEQLEDAGLAVCDWSSGERVWSISH